MGSNRMQLCKALLRVCCNPADCSRGDHKASDTDTNQPNVSSAHLLGQLQSILPSFSSLSSESVTQTCNLLKNEALLKEAVFFLVQPLVQVADARMQLILAWNFAW